MTVVGPQNQGLAYTPPPKARVKPKPRRVVAPQNTGLAYTPPPKPKPRPRVDPRVTRAIRVYEKTHAASQK